MPGQDDQREPFPTSPCSRIPDDCDALGDPVRGTPSRCPPLRANGVSWCHGHPVYRGRRLRIGPHVVKRPDRRRRSAQGRRESSPSPRGQDDGRPAAPSPREACPTPPAPAHRPPAPPPTPSNSRPRQCRRSRTARATVPSSVASGLCACSALPVQPILLIEPRGAPSGRPPRERRHAGTARLDGAAPAPACSPGGATR
jgi:hypothetical protein